MKITLLCLSLAIIAPSSPKLRAQAVPDIPEPGIIIYGQVFFAGTNTPAGINVASWLVDDGTLTFSLSASSTPATQIVAMGGQPFYVTQIPFRTHRIGTGGNLVTFNGPSGANQWFELKAASPGYFFQPFFNGGGTTTIRSVNGVAVPPGTNAISTVGLTAAERGKMVRVDLYVTAGSDGYDVWADAFLGGHLAGNQLRTGDFDGDGLRNENEWIAGSDPTDPRSGLRIISLVRAGANQQLTWQSVNGKTYNLESREILSPGSPWLPMGTVPSSGNTTTAQFPVPPSATIPREFYRVTVSP